jgi:hypothetical protein
LIESAASGVAASLLSRRSAAPKWDRGTLLASPLLHTVHGLVAQLPAARFPDHAALNGLALRHGLVNANGAPLRFVPAGDAKVAASEYEGRAYRDAEVPTRTDNWHDLFNALAWLAFPRTKALINRLHIGELARQQQRVRNVARDVLTLLDEGGMIVACSNSELIELLHAFQWQALFVARRAEVRAQMRFLVLGHAIHEQALNPFKGITAKAICFDVPPALLDQPVGAMLGYVDARAAEWLCTPGRLTHTNRLQPVPILGIPGWTPDNETPSYYADAQQFRPGRRHARNT